MNFGTIIGLDEGGPARRYLPYLIDTLPILKKTYKANISSLSFIDLPINRKKNVNYDFKKILITFGGEDPGDLSTTLINSIIKNKIFRPENLTLIKGPLFKQQKYSKKINIIIHPDNLKEQLFKYDLVFTSFGLTCFEAISANVPVILLNPSNYHKKLCRDNGLAEIGVGRPDIGKLKYLLKNKESLTDTVRKIENELEDRITLDKMLLKLAEISSKINIGSLCPLCQTILNPAAARFRLQSYFKCRKCRIIYLINFNIDEKVYEKDYFNKEYRNQYGKTYVEDFDKIKKLSYDRITKIKQIIKNKEKPEILDIGCAYGPFLEACMEMGLVPTGLDISMDAVKYVKSKLKIECINKSFLDYKSEYQFDIITMWYVIEHFKELSEVLTKINKNLRINGLFAFSTPNSTGISGKSDLINFLDKSPPDHFYILSPGIVKRILKLYGFKVKKIKITGHHPERFKIAKNKKQEKNKLLWFILKTFSRLFSFGDTFEVYAVKYKEI